MSSHPFEQVVVAHGARVLRVCRGLLGVDDADDAWSETFLKAMRAWPDLPEDLDAEAWLVTVARRTCVDHLRARARRATPAEDLPEPAIEDHERDLGIWRHVAALPAKQRAVITYRYLGGLDHARIAELVGGTEAASRRAASDGLKALREKGIER